MVITKCSSTATVVEAALEDIGVVSATTDDVVKLLGVLEVGLASPESQSDDHDGVSDVLNGDVGVCLFSRLDDESVVNASDGGKASEPSSSRKLVMAELGALSEDDAKG